jgi:hypothetical protein
MSTLTSNLPFLWRLFLILWAVLWNQLFYTRRIQIAGLSVTASCHGAEFSPLQSRPGVGVVPIVSTSRRIQNACLSVYRLLSRLSIQPSAIPP